jgi:hypothetical protein
MGHTHFEIPFDLLQFCVVLLFCLVFFLFKWIREPAMCSSFRLRKT